MTWNVSWFPTMKEACPKPARKLPPLFDKGGGVDEMSDDIFFVEEDWFIIKQFEIKRTDTFFRRKVIKKIVHSKLFLSDVTSNVIYQVWILWQFVGCTHMFFLYLAALHTLQSITCPLRIFKTQKGGKNIMNSSSNYLKNVSPGKMYNIIKLI